MQFKHYEYLGIGETRTRVYSPLTSKFLDINTLCSPANINKLLLTVIGTSGKRIVTGLECSKFDDTHVKVTSGVAVKDLVVLYINDEEILLETPLHVSGVFYVVIRYSFKSQLPSDDVNILFVLPSTYDSNENIFLYLCTVVLSEGKIDDIYVDDQLSIPPIDTIPYYLRNLSSSSTESILQNVYTKRELQISGLSAIHWNNLTHVPQLLSMETLTWENIQNKPTVFPTESHDHDSRYYTITQVQTTGHARINYENLFNVPTTFPPSTHDHDNKYYTKLQLITPNTGELVHWSNISDKPTSLPPSTHSHDDRYYTITQVQTPREAQIHWDNITNVPDQILQGPNINLSEYIKFSDLNVPNLVQIDYGNIINRPTVFPPEPHDHNNFYYTKTQLATPTQAAIHWLNIINRPTSFPVDNHDHNLLYYTQHQLQTAGEAQVHWDNIIDKPPTLSSSTCTRLAFWKNNGEQVNIQLNTDCTLSFWKSNGEQVNIQLN